MAWHGMAWHGLALLRTRFSCVQLEASASLACLEAGGVPALERRLPCLLTNAPSPTADVYITNERTAIVKHATKVRLGQDRARLFGPEELCSRPAQHCPALPLLLLAHHTLLLCTPAALQLLYERTAASQEAVLHTLTAELAR